MSKAKEVAVMRKAVNISLAGNIILFAAKAAALLFVHSLAVVTDLGVSLVSLSISVFLFYAIRLSNRPADFLHNFGYSKIEDVCEAMEGMILTGIAVAMSVVAVRSFFAADKVANEWIGLTIGLLGIVINFSGAFFIMTLAKKSRSPALVAEAIHYRLEGYISSAVAAAFVVMMLFQRLGLEQWKGYVDPVATLVVGAIIFVPSIKLVKHAFLKLLDATIEEESMMDVIGILSRHFERYCEFSNLRTRSAGRRKFVEIRLTMPESIPLSHAHGVASSMEEDIMQRVPGAEVTIKIMPCEKNCEFVRRNEACPYSPLPGSSLGPPKRGIA